MRAGRAACLCIIAHDEYGLLWFVRKMIQGEREAGGYMLVRRVDAVMHERCSTALPPQGTRPISTGNAAPARPTFLGRGESLAYLKDARSITSIGEITALQPAFCSRGSIGYAVSEAHPRRYLSSAFSQSHRGDESNPFGFYIKARISH